MSAEATANEFFIWGVDVAAYGPVELPTLVEWIKDGRVLAETWVFTTGTGSWLRAAEIPDLVKLKVFLEPVSATEFAIAVSSAGIKPGSLRRIKILAGLNDAQLAHLAQFMEMKRVPQWALVVKQDDPGDAMYLIIDGELRAQITGGGKETILATFGPGDFFGDMALFDNGPRSADVVANKDSSVLKLSTIAFERLVREAPDVAAPFLQAAAKTLAARIRTDNKRLDRVTQQFSASR
ncbi:MAG TPA: cyclic nucleotide-binding domain-containing protein [Candidatus Paceibacterota bacterium]|nr:cyclic nucleotide-binding domain-containing protein [Candidatus Paceibacterota bacterium]